MAQFNSEESRKQRQVRALERLLPRDDLITPLQKMACNLKLAKMTNKEIAAHLQVTPKTVGVWFKIENVQNYLTMLQAKIDLSVQNGVLMAYAFAWEQLIDLMENADKKTKLGALTLFYRLGGKLTSQSEVTVKKEDPFKGIQDWLSQEPSKAELEKERNTLDSETDPEKLE